MKKNHFLNISNGIFFLRKTITALVRNILLILLTFVINSQLLFATNYYVAAAPDGNDANPGTIELPWASIAKVNSKVFLPGDSILFRRGDTWTGTGLLTTASGTSDNERIVYCAYGAGNKPLIIGGGSGIYIKRMNYITIADISLSNNTLRGVEIEGSNYITILRVDVDNNGANAGIHMSSGGGNILIDGCRVTRAKNNGILIHGTTTTNLIHDVTVQNCYVGYTQGNDGILIHSGQTGTIAGSNFIFRNNVSEFNPEQGFDITTGQNILMEDNVSRNNKQGAITFGHTASNLIVRRHYSENEPTTSASATLKISGPYCIVEHSVFIGSAETNISLVDINPGSDSQPEFVKLFNNTFVWNALTTGSVFRIAPHYTGIANTIQHLEVKNNIFTTRTSAKATVSFSQADRPPDYNGFVFNNNLYFMPGGTQFIVSGNAGSPFTLTSFKSNFSQDLNGIEANPLFADPASGNFRLSSVLSPAYNTGADVTLTEYKDFDKLTVPQGVKMQIGAFAILNTIGINSAISTQTLNIFPNPCHNTISIFNDTNTKTGDITIRTITGNIIYTMKSEPGLNILDFGNYDPGIYLVELSDGNSIRNGKFIKQKE